LVFVSLLLEPPLHATVLQAEFLSCKAWWHLKAHIPLRYVGEDDPTACTVMGRTTPTRSPIEWLPQVCASQALVDSQPDASRRRLGREPSIRDQLTKAYTLIEELQCTLRHERNRMSSLRAVCSSRWDICNVGWDIHALLCQLFTRVERDSLRRPLCTPPPAAGPRPWPGHCRPRYYECEWGRQRQAPTSLAPPVHLRLRKCRRSRPSHRSNRAPQDR
jgi:hypothetical protein